MKTQSLVPALVLSGTWSFAIPIGRSSHQECEGQMKKLVQVPQLGYGIQIKSLHGNSYEIRMGKDARLYCTCPAWKFSPHGHKSCKHLRAYLGGKFKIKSQFVEVMA